MGLTNLLKTLATLLSIVLAYAYAQHSDEQHEHQVAQLIKAQSKPWRAEETAPPTATIGSAKWTR